MLIPPNDGWLADHVCFVCKSRAGHTRIEIPHMTHLGHFALARLPLAKQHDTSKLTRGANRGVRSHCEISAAAKRGQAHGFTDQTNCCLCS